MFAQNYTLEDVKSVIDEKELVGKYLGITKIPSLINSPFRDDKRPSFSIYYAHNINRVLYLDFATGEKGTIYTLLRKLWNSSKEEVYRRICEECGYYIQSTAKKSRVKIVKSNSDLACKTRQWNDDDVAYWGSFGITTPWLDYADVHPISHMIVIKDGTSYQFVADKLAYAYYEFKENKTTVKIYQPLNKNGFKWRSKHDSSVVSLWTKVPQSGKVICICSSLKDALCLWENTGIPALAIQGEGYKMSKTAQKELRKRFSTIFVCLDNDKAGLENGKRISEETGFINIVLPQFEGGKDISDYYKVINDKKIFKSNIIKIFKDGQKTNLSKD